MDDFLPCLYEFPLESPVGWLVGGAWREDHSVSFSIHAQRPPAPPSHLPLRVKITVLRQNHR